MPCYLFLLHNPPHTGASSPQESFAMFASKVVQLLLVPSALGLVRFQRVQLFVVFAFLRICFSFLKLSMKVSQDLQISEGDAKVLSNDPESDAYIDKVSFYLHQLLTIVYKQS